MLNEEQLNKLTTKRLLAYKNSLLKVNEHANWNDDDVFKLNKDCQEWKDHYNLIKSILETREHINKVTLQDEKYFFK